MSEYGSILPIRVAQQIVQEFRILKPEDIEIDKIAVDCGVFPMESTFEGSEAKLVVHPNGKVAVASINSKTTNEGRKRFSLAHELGHFVLHRAKRSQWGCTEEDFLRMRKESICEYEANLFATEILMPEHLFRPSCTGNRPGFQTASRLAEMFRTSITSTAIRYTAIGSHPCALICCGQGRIRWSTSSHDFRHRIRPNGSAVNPASGAGEFFEAGKCTTNTPCRTTPHFWLEGSETTKVQVLWEDSYVLSYYGIVLTIIWEP